MLTHTPFTPSPKPTGPYGATFPKLPKSAQWQTSDAEVAQLQVAGEATSPAPHSNCAAQWYSRNQARIASLRLYTLSINSPSGLHFISPLGPDELSCCAAGWGVTSNNPEGGPSPILRNATLSLLPPNVCNDTTQTDAGGLSIKANQLCAASEATSTCDGDSGGPLLYSPCEVHARHMSNLPCLELTTLHACTLRNTH